MKQNIGTVDRFIRLTAGFYLLGAGINKSSNFLMVTGSMKIAEGITKWCPLLHMLNKITTIDPPASNEDEAPQVSHSTEIPVT